MSEQQTLYGLIGTAQEQQKIAGDQLAAMGELKATIRQAGEAVQAMRQAGDASAAVIEKATRKAVEQAVQDVLGQVSDKARSAITDAINPAVNALQAVSGDAVGAGQKLRDSISWVGWRWGGVCTFTACGLLAAIVGLSMLLVPSPNEIVDLRAKVAALEARGGKIELTVCGPSKRLCAKIDDRSNNERKGWGQKGEYMILQGY